jgi:hypothetical protein
MVVDRPWNYWRFSWNSSNAIGVEGEVWLLHYIVLTRVYGLTRTGSDQGCISDILSAPDEPCSAIVFSESLSLSDPCGERNSRISSESASG